MKPNAAYQSGLVQYADAPGILLHEKTATRLKFNLGDFIVVASDERGTQIIRQLKAIKKAKQARVDYVYLDAESLGFLTVNLDEPLEIWPSELNMDCP